MNHLLRIIDFLKLNYLLKQEKHILLLNFDGGLCRVIHGDGLGRIGCYCKVTIPIVVPIICILIRIMAAQIEFLNPVPTGLQTLGKAECTV